MRRAAATALLFLAAAAPALAQRPDNFDCAKASTAVERAICGDTKLKLADNTLSSACYLWRADGLSILFNRCDIAPGAMGDYVVRIPYAELKPLLRPDAPVGK